MTERISVRYVKAEGVFVCRGIDIPDDAVSTDALFSALSLIHMTLEQADPAGRDSDVHRRELN